MCHRNWHTFFNKSYSTFLKTDSNKEQHVYQKLEITNGQIQRTVINPDSPYPHYEIFQMGHQI